jgi:chorismate dehydratase
MPPRLRLGHIVYSNCFPVHARLLDEPRAGDPALVAGIPSELNLLLKEGGVDVAPSSSIEYALNADRYRIVPDLVIGSRGAVRSIVLVSTRTPRELGGSVVAVPTASATSVVLLKILLRVRWGADVEYRWFDQAVDDPFANGAAAALFIGDVALRPDLHPELPQRLDLGTEWWDETGLPFAFALWQTTSGDPGLLRDLHITLRDSRCYGEENRIRLAERYASHFRMPAAELERYWKDLRYNLDEEMTAGLQAFYRFAADIGEIPAAPELQWIE